MIAFLRGKVLSQDSEVVVLDVQGVGYELYCTPSTLDMLASLKNEVGLFVYTHMREEALHLFGFSKLAEKQLFLSLNKVNGIGPKMAIKIMSGGSLDEIVRMIENDDVKSLARLPKVGKKTAEQMILTLKGKLVLSEQVQTEIPPKGTRQELVSALVNLGYRLGEVEKVVGSLDPQMDFQEGVREGLRLLSSHF
ncbi:MAG: Holliday junction branch migration protein RuvA [Bdellovibrionales bacterium]|nr:Holliday junction branch migration protein RuvA [Bdellovibrionales bacterium]